MKKPLLQTKINGITENAFPTSEVSPDNPHRLEKPAQNSRLHSQFNPSRVGFGILGGAKGVRRPAAAVDEDITAESKFEEGQ